jgi:hypothetical protein
LIRKKFPTKNAANKTCLAKSEKEAKIMENLEIKILKELDIANPYII